jgi:hypothetical protein
MPDNGQVGDDGTHSAPAHPQADTIQAWLDYFRNRAQAGLLLWLDCKSKGQDYYDGNGGNPTHVTMDRTDSNWFHESDIPPWLSCTFTQEDIWLMEEAAAWGGAYILMAIDFGEYVGVHQHDTTITQDLESHLVEWRDWIDTNFFAAMHTDTAGSVPYVITNYIQSTAACCILTGIQNNIAGGTPVDYNAETYVDHGAVERLIDATGKVITNTGNTLNKTTNDLYTKIKSSLKSIAIYGGIAIAAYFTLMLFINRKKGR